MTLNDKLTQIQTRFKSKKSRFNSFGKYNFRSAEDILEETKPYLSYLGVIVKIDEELISNDTFPIMQSTATISDGKTAIHATALVGVDLDQKGMQMPQKFGSASSYGKKYALGNLFLIDDTQDSDATNNHGKSSSGHAGLLADIEKAKSYVKSGGTVEAIKKKYKLTPDQEKQLTTLNG